MTALTTSYLSPPQYAKRLAVDPSKVVTWIKNGELRVINVATKTSGRPRYVIPYDAILEFESRRSARPVEKTKKRKRGQKQDADFVEYF